MKTLRPDSIYKGLLKVAALLGLFLLPVQLQADPPASKDIFLKRGETLDREIMASRLVTHLSPCMSLTSNKSLPSGYARIFVGAPEDKAAIRLERSTFRDNFIASCLTDKLRDFPGKDQDPKSWTFVHVVSDCREKNSSRFYDPANVDCTVNVVLNNFSENKELKEIVESHWKKEGLETSRTYYNAAQILNLLRIIKN